MFFSLCVWEELASTLQCCFFAAHPDFYTLQKDVERLFRTLSFYSLGADELSQVMLDSGIRASFRDSRQHFNGWTDFPLGPMRGDFFSLMTALVVVNLQPNNNGLPFIQKINKYK